MKKFRFKVVGNSLQVPTYMNFVGNELSDAKKIAQDEWYSVLSSDNEVQEVVGSTFILRKTISSKEKIGFFESLWDYLESSFTVRNSIEKIKRNTGGNGYFQKFLEDLYLSIESGLNLYDSISKSRYSKHFSYNQLEMIRIGEQSNNLWEILLSLVEEMELEEDIKKDMISVSIMPTVALVLIGVSSTVLFLYVLPMIIKAIWKVETYPPLTSILIGMKDFLVDYKFALLAFIVFVIFMPRLMKLSEQWAYLYDKLLVHVYGIKGLIRTRTFLQIAKILELTSKAQFNSKDKLIMLSRWVGNMYYRKYFESRIMELTKGKNFFEQFSNRKLFPVDLADKVQIWDETQLLEEKMIKYYQKTFKDFKRVIKSLKELLTYIIIIIMGVFVLLFAGWIFQLILSLNENIK